MGLNMQSRERISGATDAQKFLLEYWHSKMSDGKRVERARICPGELRLYLANISLVHLDEDGNARFRLAGSRLRDVVGIEARGRLVSEIPDLLEEAWVDGLEYTLETARPVGGVSRRKTDSHAWLRLPLRDQFGKLSIVLCHDELVSGCIVTGLGGVSNHLIKQYGSRAAA